MDGETRIEDRVGAGVTGAAPQYSTRSMVAVNK